jgi:UDP-N-acetylmuramoyl-tripeptide--D-alanyl-D-alanine ligase
MDIIWTSEDAAEATGGASHGQWEAGSIVMDSREVTKGCLFVAMKGEHTDGHNFVKQALENGAAAAVISSFPAGISECDPLLLVPDVTQALNDLASYNRNRINANFIGITGSVGKTTTKEMVRQALQSIGKTYANPGTFNNHLGVPISLASIPLDVEFVVLEMGMSAHGEIAQLTKQVRPDIAIITNIAPAHLEFFTSTGDIAQAKCEIFQGMGEYGTAILNADDALFEQLSSSALEHNIQDIISFGVNKEADVVLLESTQQDEALKIKADVLYEPVTFSIATINPQHALGALSALAVVHTVGGDVEVAAAALSSFVALEGRGRITHVTFNDKKLIIVDDSYNSSPVAVSASIKALGSWKIQEGRKIAILGDMLELGPDGKELHAGLAQDIIANKIDKVITIGPLMKNLYNALPDDTKLAAFDKIDNFLEVVNEYIENGDICLVKGSKSTYVSKLVQLLLKK